MVGALILTIIRLKCFGDGLLNEMLWRWTPQYKQDFELALETDPRLHKNRLAE